MRFIQYDSLPYVRLLFLGPESRPMNEHQEVQSSTTTTTSDNNNNTEQAQPTSNNSNTTEPQTTANRGRNLQNFFMQRMSDILTQLVANTETNSETSEPTAAEATAEAVQPEPTIPVSSSPVVELPPSPSPTEQEARTTTNRTENDVESDNSQDVCLFVFKF